MPQLTFPFWNRRGWNKCACHVKSDITYCKINAHITVIAYSLTENKDDWTKKMTHSSSKSVENQSLLKSINTAILLPSDLWQ